MVAKQLNAFAASVAAAVALAVSNRSMRANRPHTSLGVSVLANGAVLPFLASSGMMLNLRMEDWRW